MSSGEDPVAWLRAQVEARLTAARLAAREGGTWTQDGVHTGSISSLGGQVVYDEGSPDEYQAAHIALNDPRDVIARCEAELAILDEHDESETPEELRHGHWEGHGSNERWIRNEPNDCPVCGDESPCRTVRLLASGYKHRPGYAEAWPG